MAVSAFTGSLLYLSSGQAWAACSLILGYVAGELAYHANGCAEHARGEPELWQVPDVQPAVTRRAA